MSSLPDLPEPRRWRKKPVVIEAVQYLPPDTDDVLLPFLEGCTDWYLADEGVVIPTLEGDLLARQGDWIIKGVPGEFYPVEDSIFQETYEAVSDA